jgi:uncharacterized protein YdeI (YjbR/CyaY-like superfamily)
MSKIESVDQYLEEKVPAAFQSTFTALRGIIRETAPELNETIKWGAPCYVRTSNVVGIVVLKNYVALWFYQGALLDDPKNQLIQASEKTTALRQLRFEQPEDIDTEYLTTLLQEAVENDRQGKKVKPRRKQKPMSMPFELKQVLDSKANLKANFETLSPSQKREYIEHVGEAKRASTRERRAKKAGELLAEGKGLNDKYRGRKGKG